MSSHEMTTYDNGAFTVRRTRFGLYVSYRQNGDQMTTGLTEEAVVFATRFRLKAEQDGTLWTENVKVMGSAIVGGKL